MTVSGAPAPAPALPERLEIRPGYRMARVINGCWQLSDGHRPGGVDRRRAIDGLLRRVDAGLTTFDCADIYAGVESLLGALGRAVRQRGGPEIQIHTKLVPDHAALPTLDRRYVERIVDRSLRRLGVERLDLVQLHWWHYDVPGWLDAAGWLDDLRRAGKVAALGVTNFDLPRLRTLCDAGLPIVALQLQYSLLDRRPERHVVDFCRSRGIALLAYGTLAGGYLGARHLGAPDRQPSNRSLVKYRLMIDEAGGWARFQALLVVLDDIARRHGSTLSSVALRALLDRPGVGAAIVGTRGDEHLDETLAVFRMRLEASDHELLERALAELIIPPGDVYDLERAPEGRHARIMKTDLNAAGDTGARRAVATGSTENGGGIRSDPA